MANRWQKCETCGGMLDEEDLFCSNCGTGTPGQVATANPSSMTVATHNFACEGCGASMSYDAGAKALRCPFCGSEKLSPQKDAKVYGASWIVPFRISRNDATALLRKWLSSKFWAPSDLANVASVVGMTGIFVPYWVFSANTFTYWTADSSNAPSTSMSGWVPIAGENRASYNGLLVGASSVLSPQETHEIAPFQMEDALSIDKVNLEKILYEQFRVQPKYARHLAQQGLEERELEACAKKINGRHRHLKVNVRTENLSTEGILLPVWVMAYRYNHQVYRFLINGQTGRSTGTSPVSAWKVMGVVAVALLAAMFLFAILAAMAAR